MQKKKKQLQLVIVSTAVLLIALLYLSFDPATSAWFPKCPFYLLTGLYCPGCGSQRAVASLLHGEVLAAVKFNILLVAFLPLLIYSATVSVVNVFGAKPVTQTIFYSPVFVKIVLGVVILFAILRNIPVAPFKLLAPHN